MPTAFLLLSHLLFSSKLLLTSTLCFGSAPLFGKKFPFVLFLLRSSGRAEINTSTLSLSEHQQFL